MWLVLDKILEKRINDDASSVTPVGIVHRRSVRIICRQHKYNEMVTYHRSTSPNDALQHPAPWVLKLWRGYKWDEEVVIKIIKLLNANSLKTNGSGAIRDQWGSFALSFMSKHDDKIIGTREGPVHGHRDPMREIRAESTYMYLPSSHFYSRSNHF